MAMAVRASTEEDLEPPLEPKTPALESHNPGQQPNTSKPYRYNEVHVLMFLWEDDDLHVLNEVNDLKAVFETHYHFTSILISVIPSRKPYDHVKNEIQNLRYVLDRTDSLVIVYYSGHGHLFGYGKMTWSAYEKPKSICKLIPGLRWSLLQSQLERAPSDVLILLDCCESGGSLHSSPPPSSPSNPQGTTELIAASPFDTLAPGPGELSFTGALITELKVLAAKGEMFSVAELHRRVLANIIERRTGWRTRVQRERQWPSVSPVYVRLVGGVEVPSIGLMPLGARESREWVAEEKEAVQISRDIEVDAAPEMLSVPLEKTTLEVAPLGGGAWEIERKNSSPEACGGMYDEKMLVEMKKRGALGRAVRWVKALVFKVP